MKIFGFDLSRLGKQAEIDDPKDKVGKNQPKSFVPPTSEDGSQAIAAGGYYGQYLDLDGDAAKTDVDLIRKYRVSAEQPECDSAIDDIVNEAIVADEEEGPINLNLDNLDQPPRSKKRSKKSLMKFFDC